MTVALLAGVAACTTADRRGDVVIFASGADLQSINPLLTLHPLARQVQRYALLTTLVRYDSSLTPVPYLARAWTWSPDRRQLTMHLDRSVAWHDGVPTTARDAQWTLDAARDPVVGYPRQSELHDLAQRLGARRLDPRTGLEHAPQDRLPDVLTDLAILPSHLLDTVPRDRLRQAAWNEQPVGNGPFRFVRHEPNRRWVFERNPAFPASLGGPPHIDRLVIAVVDEPMTKLAALVGGELDFAGIQPGHAPYVKKHADLAVVDYPLFFTYVIALNTRRPPFDDLAVRQRLAGAIDRQEIVDGYAYGYRDPGDRSRAAGCSERCAVRALRAFRAYPRLPRLSPSPSSSSPSARATTSSNRCSSPSSRRAGFTVTIRQLELSAFLDRVYGPTHDFTAAVMGVPGDIALGYLRPLGDVAGMTVPRDPAVRAATFPRLDPGHLSLSRARHPGHEPSRPGRADGHPR